MISDLGIDHGTLEAFCRRWSVKELSLFGSVLTDHFRSDSDVDVLLSFGPEAEWSLLDLSRMRLELIDLFGRDVDVLTRRAVERSGNPIRREEILSSARALYAA